MLIPKEMLIKATELSVADVDQALKANGYTDNNDLHSVTFAGQNSTGAYVYDILFDEDGEALSTEDLGEGKVYVKIRRKALSRDLEFYAEY